jgi:hypothetical protein
MPVLTIKNTKKTMASNAAAAHHLLLPTDAGRAPEQPPPPSTKLHSIGHSWLLDIQNRKLGPYLMTIILAGDHRLPLLNFTQYDTVVLLDMQNRKFGPCLMTIILVGDRLLPLLNFTHAGAMTSASAAAAGPPERHLS